MIKLFKVGVQFEGTPYKTYYYNSLIELNENDIVVVQARDSIALGRVVETSIESDLAIKFVVCKVDYEEFEKTLEKVAKQKELESKLEKRFSEVNKMDLYEKLAQKDEVMKSLLEELKAIN